MTTIDSHITDEPMILPQPRVPACRIRAIVPGMDGPVLDEAVADDQPLVGHENPIRLVIARSSDSTMLTKGRTSP